MAVVLQLGFGYFSVKLGDFSEQGESKHDQKNCSPLPFLRVYLKLVRISLAATVFFLITLCPCLLRSLFLRNGLCSLCSCAFPGNPQALLLSISPRSAVTLVPMPAPVERWHQGFFPSSCFPVFSSTCWAPSTKWRSTALWRPCSNQCLKRDLMWHGNWRQV